MRFAALDLRGADADAAVGDTREDARSTRLEDYTAGRTWERGDSTEGMSSPREDEDLGAFTRGLGSPSESRTDASDGGDNVSCMSPSYPTDKLQYVGHTPKHQINWVVVQSLM